MIHSLFATARRARSSENVDRRMNVKLCISVPLSVPELLPGEGDEHVLQGGLSQCHVGHLDTGGLETLKEVGDPVVHGHAGDITGLSARGGKIFIREDVGYRAGIHMKEYGDKKPILVIGGSAQDFLGEYMAGGILILLGLNLKEGEKHQANFIGTGMHGGVIYIRGNIDDYQIGMEVGITEPNDIDHNMLVKYLNEFATNFNYKISDILNKGFVKLYPRWKRPYGRLYSY